jgi:hypothetical protein
MLQRQLRNLNWLSHKLHPAYNMSTRTNRKHSSSIVTTFPLERVLFVKALPSKGCDIYISCGLFLVTDVYSLHSNGSARYSIYMEAILSGSLSRGYR